jgi:hypothetical protein
VPYGIITVCHYECIIKFSMFSSHVLFQIRIRCNSKISRDFFEKKNFAKIFAVYIMVDSDSHGLICIRNKWQPSRPEWTISDDHWHPQMMKFPETNFQKLNLPSSNYYLRNYYLRITSCYSDHFHLDVLCHQNDESPPATTITPTVYYLQILHLIQLNCQSRTSTVSTCYLVNSTISTRILASN